MIQNCPDSRLKDGGKIVSSKHWPLSTLQKHFLSQLQAHRAAERIGKLKILNDLIGTRTGDLPACSIVPQTTTLPSALHVLQQYSRDPHSKSSSV
jgi:hypothetical protein